MNNKHSCDKLVGQINLLNYYANYKKIIRKFKFLNKI